MRKLFALLSATFTLGCGNESRRPDPNLDLAVDIARRYIGVDVQFVSVVPAVDEGDVPHGNYSCAEGRIFVENSQWGNNPFFHEAMHLFLCDVQDQLRCNEWSTGEDGIPLRTDHVCWRTNGYYDVVAQARLEYMKRVR